MFPLKASTCFNHDPSVLLYHAAAIQAGKASWHVHACRCFNMDHPQYKVSKQSGIPWASRGGFPVQVNCQFWQLCTSFKALCTTRWTRFGYINIIRNQWGWIPWQHQQWPTILDNQEVNPIWIRAHPIICDYVGRSLSSSGNMINSHGSLGQSSYRMIHDHLHGSLRHSAIFWHGPMLPNTIPSAAMAWIPGASLPLTPLEQLETTKSCWTDTFLSMWPGVT